jgi:hypothetical protein
MKGNENKIAFIFFHFLFRIGTFQWVTADSNKKIFPFFRSAGSARGPVHVARPPSWPSRGFNPTNGNA